MIGWSLLVFEKRKLVTKTKSGTKKCSALVYVSVIILAAWKQWSVLQLTTRLREFMTQMPTYLQEAVENLLHRDPRQRPTAQLFSMVSAIVFAPLISGITAGCWFYSIHTSKTMYVNFSKMVWKSYVCIYTWHEPRKLWTCLINLFCFVEMRGKPREHRSLVEVFDVK